MKASRLAALLPLALVTTMAAVAGTAAVASAAPTNCTVTYGANWAQSYCAAGAGEHRVHMLQQHFMPGVGPIICVGPWVPAGSVSYTPCANHTIVNVWYSTRG